MPGVPTVSRPDGKEISNDNKETGETHRSPNGMNFESSSAGNPFEDEQEGFIMPRFMIHPKSPLMFKINMLRLITRVYIAIIIPFRIPFEERPHVFWFSWDCILNVILLIDIFINFCTAFENSKGKIVTNRKTIAWRYIRGAFFLHLLSWFPFTGFRYFNTGGSHDDSQNFLALKFERLPRFYRMWRAIKLARLMGFEKNYLEFLDRLKISLNAVKMISIFIKLFLLLHIIACWWATSANFELTSNTNWLVANDVQNNSMYSRYITAFYWAVVTTTTVGYGDIVPVNKFEIGLALIIIILGVAYYSYVIGNLSFLFSSILGQQNASARRKAQIK